MAMRLDKFLKVSRIIKRRTVAKEAAEKDKVEINGKVAKPSSAVNVGDVLTLHLVKKSLT
jgi:ribosomal 50S subunit-recycling heat shock protein